LDFSFGDIDADGNLDLITSSEKGLVFFGDGKGDWTRRDIGATNLVYGFGPSLGDVNNDGYLDVAGINPSTGKPEVYLWDNGTQSWKAVSTGISISGLTATALADMDNDGNIDLVAGGSNKIIVWTGDGTGRWTQAKVISVPGYPVSLRASGDLDHNGYNDIVVINGNPNVPHVFLNDAPVSQLGMFLQYPRGGERFYPGSARFIDYTYSSPGGAGTVKLELSTTGNAGPWALIVDNYKDGGRYQWTVPNTPSKNCFIRATVTVNGSTATDMNAKPFEILDPSGFVPYMIYGYVYDSGGHEATGAVVNITNENTAEYSHTSTDVNGFYQLDLSRMTAGFVNGDRINVSAIAGSEGGFNETIVTGGHGKRVDVHLVINVPGSSNLTTFIIGILIMAVIIIAAGRSKARKRERKQA
jgi:hypothetical protein